MRLLLGIILKGMEKLMLVTDGLDAKPQNPSREIYLCSSLLSVSSNSMREPPHTFFGLCCKLLKDAKSYPILIVLRGGGNIHHAQQNLLKSGRVRTIITLL